MIYAQPRPGRSRYPFPCQIGKTSSGRIGRIEGSRLTNWTMSCNGGTSVPPETHPLIHAHLHALGCQLGAELCKRAINSHNQLALLSTSHEAG